ncbi:MAG TPA: diaminopimelate epimerase [Polyangia bacterium]|jgi:diaminopimelate epimerase
MLRFVKYHGLGNDFVLVDLRDGEGTPSPLDPVIVARLCDRHFGVGADGVLGVLKPAEPGHHARMRIMNADGSEAEMCGNGIRCMAKYLHDHGAVRRREILIDTLAGVMRCGVTDARNGTVESVAVQMGAPALAGPSLPKPAPFVEGALEVAGRTLRVTAVSMGNPHAVVFVDEPPRPLAETLGPLVEKLPAFPHRTNVEFVRVQPDGTLDTAVWERGCGITLACGTGACATAVAATVTKRAAEGQELAVRLPGGTLHVTVAPGLAGVTMRGPATEVFRGELELADFARR